MLVICVAKFKYKLNARVCQISFIILQTRTQEEKK